MIPYSPPLKGTNNFTQFNYITHYIIQSNILYCICIERYMRIYYININDNKWEHLWLHVDVET